MTSWMRKSLGVLVAAALLPWEVGADLQTGFFDAFRTTGTPETFQTLSPTVRKWYLPQTLYYLYGWKNHEYTNYSRENYSRYVDIFLEGDRYYDVYGNFITRAGRSTTGGSGNPRTSATAF